MKDWKDFRTVTVEKLTYATELFKLYARKGAKDPKIVAVHADRSDKLYEVELCRPEFQ